MAINTTYLEKFRSALPRIQGNHILKMLIAKRDNGEIRTLEEFKSRLKSLTEKLLQENLVPTLRLYAAQAGQDISAEQFNQMMERVQDDLEAAFGEADNLDEIIAAHDNVIRNASLQVLRFGINELESKVTLYEFLNRSNRGFDDALFNTFRESQNFALSRSHQDAGIVFVDPRLGDLVDLNEDALVDTVGERLLLGSNLESFKALSAQSLAAVVNAGWLSNTFSVRSELDVQPENSDINNITDETSKYWIAPLLFKEIQPGGVFMEIVINMSSSQDINFVDIYPAILFPLKLTRIDYFDSNNTRQELLSPDLTLEGPTRVNFGRINTRALVLRFLQLHYREVQFKQRPGTNNFYRAVLNQNQPTVDLSAASEDLREILTSDFILSDIMSVPEDVNELEKFWEYLIGFDRIQPGFNIFNERAIFVSQKKTVDNLGQIALRSVETRPVQASTDDSIQVLPFTYPTRSTSENAKLYHGSIEYWVTTKGYAEDDTLLALDIFPVLPLGATRIYHERLLLTHKNMNIDINNNQGALMFFCDASSDSNTGVKVYKNGIELVYGVGWTFVANGVNDALTQISVNAGTRMKRAIHILGTVDLLDIFTVSYTPKQSNVYVKTPEANSLVTLVDMSGDERIRMVRDNVIMYDGQKDHSNIVKTDVFLTIILRRNSANENFSPTVDEYMLLVSSVNSEKFLSDA